jgi:hypothetical protein
MEAQRGTIFVALASAVLLTAPLASISTPAIAQSHGGGFHGGGGFHSGGGFHGGGGFRGARGLHGAGGFQGGDAHRDGFRGGGRHDRDGVIVGLPFGYYDDYYDDPDGYDVGSYDDGSPACGSWSWDGARSRYVWIPC